MKTFRFTGMALLALLLSFSFAACGDDDEGGTSTGTPSTDTSVITTDDGETLLLTSIKRGSYTCYSFDYDNQGRCISIGGYDDYEMSYDPFTLEYSDIDDDESYNFTVSFNKSGYISKISVSEKWGDKEEGEEGSGTYNFSYDGSGHLTKVSMSGNGKYYDDGDTESWSSSCTNTLVWSSGNLISSEEVWKENYDGDVWKDTDTYTYEYGSTENEYNVYTYEIAMNMTEDLGAFALIGFFGKGTAYLPTACYNSWIEEEDGDEDEGSYNSTLSYTLNSNGTIKTEKSNSNTYTYAYSTLSESTRVTSVELNNEDSSSESAKTLVSNLLHGKHAKSRK